MKHTPPGKLLPPMMMIMKSKKLRMIVGSRATAAISVLAGVALIAAFILTDRDFGPEFPSERTEATAIDLDAALGATVEPLDRVTAENLGIPSRDKGLVITSLGENGPAAQAGIRSGDVIERIGGIAVGSPGEAVEVLKHPRTPDIALTLNRRGHYTIVHLPIRVLPGRVLTEQGGER
ncbi:MAG: periplasmic serine protease, DO/DeqQ family [Sphingomonas bacterium]|uniref:PDZ domain-containing protein n=1 Tax=Sphingomonas bacterium TaxID=1895847 RepID=UPI002630A375|nr:PDZ domain-containing protein [Sphingomonas bacterium]MDB5702929.1 periplasmic serine protease, DO/DeqQ family [Sphingomonas bacterium]